MTSTEKPLTQTTHTDEVNTTNATSVTTAQIIDVENIREIPDGVVVDEEPQQIKKICVIYNKDSMASVMAAGNIKVVLEQNKDILDSVYHFTFMEIGWAYITEKFDAFLWVGLHRNDAVCAERNRGVYALADHFEASDRTIWITREPSVLDDLLTEYSHRTDQPVNVVFDGHRTNNVQTHGLSYGVVLHSLCSFSAMVPEVDFTEADIHLCSLIQSQICRFYTVTASVDSIISTWTYMHSYMAKLDLPHRVLTGLSSDEILKLYISDYRRVRQNLERGVELQKCTENKKSVKVAVSRMSDDFWMARRVLSMTFERFYNYRFADFGTHVTTNVNPQTKDIIVRAEVNVTN